MFFRWTEILLILPKNKTTEYVHSSKIFKNISKDFPLMDSIHQPSK